MAENIEIIIGTYEEFLLGYRFNIKNETPSLTQTFADKSHSGSIRCVAVHKSWVASGGMDDRIFIYDMSSRRQSQILLHHEGTITSLHFTPDGTHLLSGGEDGRMIATRIKSWFSDATWKKAHNGYPVTHIRCHPSGKLALSLGSDLILRTWNLVKGRVAYKTNLKSRNTLGHLPDCLEWSPNGDSFTITGQRLIEFGSIKTAEVVHTHKTKSKPVCLAWITNDACLVGLEDGKILWLSIENEQEKEIAAHNARVKAMCVFKQNLVSASSSGEIKLWQINESTRTLKEVASTNIGCRPTCMGILDLTQFGDNYVLSATLATNESETKPTCSKRTVHQRGIVTIEYDNDDAEEKEESTEEEEKDDQGNSNSEEDREVDSLHENESGVDSESNDDDSVSGEDNNDSNSEPEIRMPKSRKHKLQIVKRQEQTQKKQKLNSKRNEKPNLNQPQKSKQNKRKLKLKNK